jgi:hypothetical protein
MDVTTITRERDLLPANDRQYGMHNRRNETIVGKKIEIGAGQVCDQFYSCTFKDCEIRLLAAGRLVGVATHGQVFQDCLIWASRIQRIPTWEAAFERCSFRGTYETRFAGPVIDCDFSATRLVSAAFLQAESLGQVIWPKWPHVVLDSPTSNCQDWSQIPLPKDFNRFVIPKTGIAAVFNLADAVDDPEAMWELIRYKDYVHAILEAKQPNSGISQ